LNDIQILNGLIYFRKIPGYSEKFWKTHWKLKKFQVL